MGLRLVQGTVFNGTVSFIEALLVEDVSQGSKMLKQVQHDGAFGGLSS